MSLIHKDQAIKNGWDVNWAQGARLVNIDGSIGDEPLGRITGELSIGGFDSIEEALVGKIGRHEMVLGRNFMRRHNPQVRWRNDGPDEITIGGETIHGIRKTDGLAAESRSAQIAEKHKKEERPIEEIVPPELHDYLDVFSETLAAKLPDHKPYDCAIELLEGKQPPKGGIYRLSPLESTELKSQLDDMLAKGWIRKSTSPAGAGVMFQMTKDGKLRLCIDYRGLNSVTKKNSAVLPLPDELIDTLKDASYYCTLDVANAYHRIRIKDGDEWKTAFNTKYGHYEYMVMPFGLTNAPAIFQELMNDIFHDLIDVTVVIYLDDIVVFGKTREETIAATRIVLDRLRQNGLYCKAKKCEFLVQEIDFLGFHITNKGITMDKHKVDAINDWPTPNSVKDIQTFMGFCNFYRRFIEGFSRITVPINKLLRKDVKWNWEEEQQEAFDTLKLKFTTAPLLIWPNYSQNYILEADSSDYARGAILSQELNGERHPIAFISKSLTKEQRGYDIWNKELLAIVAAFLEWRYLLLGRLTIVITDHLNLKTYATKTIPVKRQRRWMGILENYNYEIHYQPGRLSRPDELSRRPDHRPKEGAENSSPGIIPEIKFKNFPEQVEGSAATPTDATIEQEIEDKSRLDPDLKIIYEALEKDGNNTVKKSINEEYRIVGNTVIHRDRVYVPNNEEIKKKIIHSRHDSELAGHPGQHRTNELIQRDYYWPGMTKYINKYVETCDRCQRTKKTAGKRKGELQPLPAPEGPWTDITYDLIVGLPRTKDGHDSILNVVDRHTKRGHFIPTTETIDAVGTAELFKDHVWRHHGLPLRTISDRGPQFNSAFLKALYKELNIEPRFSTAYHPQTDGQSERVNQFIEQFLRLYTNYQQNDWDRFLPMAEFAYNNTENETIKTTPFFADTGRHPNYTPRRMNRMGQEIPTTQAYLEQRRRVEDDIRAAITLAGAKNEKYYNQGIDTSPNYEVGDQVWLSRVDPRTQIAAVRTTRPSQKLEDRKFGPYKIKRRLNHTYELEIPPTMKIHPVIHESRLSPYHKDQLGRVTPPQPPIITEKGAEYQVERIVAARWTNHRPRQFQYRVSWLGYDGTHDTWEPVKNVENAPKKVLQFHRENPDAPKPQQA